VEFNELQRWLESQSALWQQLLATDVDVDVNAIDWQPLLLACRKLADQQGIGLQSDLADAMTQQVKGFCRYGLSLLKQLKSAQHPQSLELHVATLCHHLHEQAQLVLLRQWKIPEALARIAISAAPQMELANPLAMIEQLLQHCAHETKQARIAALAAELQRFQRALLCYRDRLQQLNHGVACALLQRAQQTPGPQTLADLHNQWVNCYEDEYQRMLRDAGYQQLYGELTNSTLRLQQQGQAFWQEEYRQAGLVPQQDYDCLLQQQHATRKQLRQSRQSNERMAARLAALEQHVELIRTTTDQRLGKVEGTQVSLVRKRKA